MYVFKKFYPPIFSLFSLFSFIAIHYLQPETNIISTKFSDYIFGSYGFLVPISLSSFALSQFLLAFKLYKNKKYTKIANLLIISGLGGLVASIFPTTIVKDINPVRIMHSLGAGLNFIAFPISMILYSITMKKPSFLKRYYLTTSVVSILFFISFIVFMITDLHITLHPIGIIEKIDIFLLYVSFIIWSYDVTTSP